MSRVVHFDLNAKEPDRAIRFYETIFDWKFNKWDGPMEYWMIKTGEERGDLENVLYYVAQYYDERYYELREEAFHYIEPFLIILLGIIIGIMVISLYLPLFTIPKILGRE